MAARTLLAEPRSAGNEETWSTFVAKFVEGRGLDYHLPKTTPAVSAAAAAAVLASATEAEDGNAPPWRPDNEYTSEVLFNVISSRIALSGPGMTINGSRTCIPSSIPTSEGRSSAGA